MGTGITLLHVDDGTQGNPPDDATVVQHACAAPAAFELLYHRYRDRLYWYLRARTPSDEDAADLTQQVLVHAQAIDPHATELGGPVS